MTTMTKRTAIDQFLSQKKLAVAGVSRSGKKFSNSVYKALKNKGYTVYAINPNVSEIENEACYTDVYSLPKNAEGIVVLTPSQQTETVVKDAAAAGIKHIWIQQGAESKEAIDYCEANGINVIHNQCILMFIEQSFPHSFHRFFAGVFGKIPK